MTKLPKRGFVISRTKNRQDTSMKRAKELLIPYRMVSWGGYCMNIPDEDYVQGITTDGYKHWFMFCPVCGNLHAVGAPGISTCLRCTDKSGRRWHWYTMSKSRAKRQIERIKERQRYEKST